MALQEQLSAGITIIRPTTTDVQFAEVTADGQLIATNKQNQNSLGKADLKNKVKNFKIFKKYQNFFKNPIFFNLKIFLSLKKSQKFF